MLLHAVPLLAFIISNARYSFFDSAHINSTMLHVTITVYAVLFIFPTGPSDGGVSLQPGQDPASPGREADSDNMTISAAHTSCPSRPHPLSSGQLGSCLYYIYRHYCACAHSQFPHTYTRTHAHHLSHVIFYLVKLYYFASVTCGHTL